MDFSADFDSDAIFISFVSCVVKLFGYTATYKALPRSTRRHERTMRRSRAPNNGGVQEPQGPDSRHSTRISALHPVLYGADATSQYVMRRGESVTRSHMIPSCLRVLRVEAFP